MIQKQKIKTKASNCKSINAYRVNLYKSDTYYSCNHQRHTQSAFLVFRGLQTFQTSRMYIRSGRARLSTWSVLASTIETTTVAVTILRDKSHVNWNIPTSRFFFINFHAFTHFWQPYLYMLVE